MTSKAIDYLNKAAAAGSSPTAVLDKYTQKGYDAKACLATAKEFSTGFGKFGQVQAAAVAVHLMEELGIVPEDLGDNEARDLAAILVELTNASGYSAKLGRKAEATSIASDY